MPKYQVLLGGMRYDVEAKSASDALEIANEAEAYGNDLDAVPVEVDSWAILDNTITAGVVYPRPEDSGDEPCLTYVLGLCDFGGLTPLVGRFAVYAEHGFGWILAVECYDVETDTWTHVVDESLKDVNHDLWACNGIALLAEAWRAFSPEIIHPA